MKISHILLIVCLPFALRAMEKECESDIPDSDIEEAHSSGVKVDLKATRVLSSLKHLNISLQKSDPVLKCCVCNEVLMFQNKLNENLENTNILCGKCKKLRRSK